MNNNANGSTHAALRILLLSSAYNSLTQLVHVELLARQYEIGIATATTGAAMQAAVEHFDPDLVLCPMLAQVIPRSVWEQTPCLILHPGILGDRGPSSLDWAILNGEAEWGVTVVEAADEVDSGPIWGSRRFPMRAATKSSLYRDEVANAALQALLTAVERFAGGRFIPQELDYRQPGVQGRFRPLLRQAQRQIDWQSESTEAIVRKIRCADGQPGVLDEIAGVPVFLYGAHPEGRLVGKPGTILATRHGAICRATVDGAIWITHLRRQTQGDESFFKLPATDVLGDRLSGVPEIPIAIDQICSSPTFRDIGYEERNGVGYVNFDFYNGAMGTDHCRRLAAAVEFAKQRPTRVIVLQSGRDYFSNGIHLNLIEAASDPAQESWENINAMNDLVYSVLSAEHHLTVAALYGSAGAGGVMLAAAADVVAVREGVVLNPHYKAMGGLYGSEYWTYTLPKRVGVAKAVQLTEECRPIGARQARAIGLIDEVVLHDDGCPDRFAGFRQQIERYAEHLARSEELAVRLAKKCETRNEDEQIKPLARYREEELTQMRRNFWGPDRSYHLARAAFVRKQPRPAHLPCFVATPADRASPGPRTLEPNDLECMLCREQSPQLACSHSVLEEPAAAAPSPTLGAARRFLDSWGRKRAAGR